MNSLRSRLIAGVSLVAIVPLAIALVLWTQRLQDSVHRDASNRLSASLQRAVTALRDEAGALSERLELLSQDAQLRRLFLVGSGSHAELREYLAAQRTLMGLDELQVMDAAGHTVARAIGDPTRIGDAGEAGEAGSAVGRGARIVSRGALADSAGRVLVLEAEAPIRYLGDRVGTLRAARFLDTAYLTRLSGPGDLRLATFDAAGRAAASNFGDASPPGAPPRADPEPVEWEGRGFLARSVPIPVGNAPYASVAAYSSTSGIEATLRSLRLSAAGLAVLALAIAIALGVLLSLQISRPVERLAAFSGRIARGEWDEPLREEGVRELRTLVASLERMRQDLGATRERLAAGERQAAYGQMARKVAHEIKNPLTPIAISIADLKRSFDQRRPEFPEILEQAARTIGDEVERLKQLIQDFSEFGRFPAPRLEEIDLRRVGSDLATLYGHEIAAGRLVLSGFDGGAPRLRADGDQLRQVLVNLLQNGLDAAGSTGHVELATRTADGEVELTVRDDGPGLGAEQRANLFVPGFTTKSGGSGLGLTIVERIVTDHRGTIAVDTSSAGTTFRIRFPRHPGA